MPQNRSSRRPRRACTLSPPDDLVLGAALLAGLQSRGLLQRVNVWLPLSRRAGHGAGALFAFALAYLAAGRRWGIRPFSLAFGTALNGLLAPLVGLLALPTAASVSRALCRLKHATVRGFVDQLLTSDLETSAVLASPHVRHRDANGRGWHVLDFDPTIEAFRQRGLPQDVSLPEAQRLAPGTPGYTGHKRGELRIRHLPLQHAGSAVWLAYRLDATGGSLLPFLAELLRQGRATLDRVSPGDIVVRADGEFGSVGAMRTCLAAQVHVLTRLSRYALIERAEVRTSMATASWRAVVSAGGGPTREAADLGVLTLYPDADAQDADGGPVDVRVVVTRFPRSSPPEHGVLRDGFQVELFATSLPADAWPAEEVVTLYFGRGAMENRFAQEDREIGIDRTFSYNPPGQEWMSGVGLFLWNLLIGRGFAAAPVPPEIPAQEPHAHLAEADPPNQAVSVPLGTDAPNESDDTPEHVASPEPSADHDPAPSAAVPDGTRDEERELRQELWSIAKKAFDVLPLPDGWILDDHRAQALCPNGERLFVYAVETQARPRASGEPKMKHRIMLRTDTRACHGCPLRAECTSAERNVYKQVSRAISATEALHARELLTRLKRFARKDQIRRINAGRAARRTVDAPVPTPLLPLRTAAVAVPPGPLRPAPPLFLPAASRQLVRDLLRRVGVEIVLTRTMARRRPTHHPLLAATAAARQHQRLSWTQRTNRWIYSGEASLSLGGVRGLPSALRTSIVKMLAL